MAILSGHIGSINGSLTDVDTQPKVNVGNRLTDTDGKEYIYLAGVASTALGSVVTYNPSTGATTLAVANAVGPVAVALAATVANTYGWYQVLGAGTAKTGTVAANKACFLTATAGTVDDAVVTGDLILGMTTLGTDSAGLASVALNYPVVTDVLG